MAQEALFPEDLFVKLISALTTWSNKTNEDTGIPENKQSRFTDQVLPRKEAKDRVKERLEGNEQRRMYSIGRILAQAFFDFGQSKKQDVKQATIVSETKKTVETGSGFDFSKFKNLKNDIPGFLKTVLIVTGAMIALRLYFGKIADIIVPISFYLGKLTTFLMKARSTDDAINGALMKMTTTYVKFKKMLDGMAELMVGTKLVNNVQKWFRNTYDIVKGFVKASELATKIITPIKNFVTGIGSFFTSLTSAGKGIAEVATKTQGVRGILGTAMRAVGSKLALVFKTIPIIGGLISFFFAYKYFKEGKVLRGIVELLGGIGSFLTLTGAGAVIGVPLMMASLGVGLLMDLLEEKPAGAQASATVKAVKIGFRMILRKLAVAVGSKFLKVLKWIPIVGGVAGIALSYMRFKEGDWLGGIIELIAAAADFIPVYGTAVSMVLDGALLLYDLLRSPKEEKGEKVEGKKERGGLMAVIGKAMKNVGSSLLRQIEWIPVIGNIFVFGRGIASLLGGDFTGGLYDIFKGLLLFLPPNVTDILVSGLGVLFGLFDGGEKEQRPVPTVKKTSFVDIVKKYVASKMKSLPLWLRKPLEWMGILKSDDKSTESAPSSEPSAFNDGTQNSTAKIVTGFDTFVNILASSVDKWISRVEKIGDSASDRVSAVGMLKSQKVDDSIEKQNQMIATQNYLLTGILEISRQHLIFDKTHLPNSQQASAPVILPMPSNTGMNTSYSTSLDPRTLFVNSPYSLTTA